MDVKALLQLMVQKDISDIHFKADAAPALRLNGRLVLAETIKALPADQVRELALGLMNDKQKREFESLDEMDLATTLDGVSRFRVNVFRQRGSLALSLRVVPLKVKTFDDLNLPKTALEKMSAESRGLILFAGITGAGKTTSMNSFLDHINATQSYRIITIEDPIEFYHQDKKSSIVQREVGHDTKNFAGALKSALRQDPDVVVVGEMRDAETIHAALVAAETGHLVLSTIHTIDSVQTVDRIIDAFPAHQQNQVRGQLAGTLKGVVGQRLVSSADGKTRYPATEILVMNSLVGRHIRENKPLDILKAVEGGGYYGMHSFDQDLVRLCKEAKIDQATALEAASNPEDLALKLKGIGTS